MKKLMTILILGVTVLTSVSCSQTRKTKKADPQAAQNEPMRNKDQDEKSPTSGHQNDRVRENNP